MENLLRIVGRLDAQLQLLGTGNADPQGDLLDDDLRVQLSPKALTVIPKLAALITPAEIAGTSRIARRSEKNKVRA